MQRPHTSVFGPELPAEHGYPGISAPGGKQKSGWTLNPTWQQWAVCSLHTALDPRWWQWAVCRVAVLGTADLRGKQRTSPPPHPGDPMKQPYHHLTGMSESLVLSTLWPEEKNPPLVLNRDGSFISSEDPFWARLGRVGDNWSISLP